MGRLGTTNEIADVVYWLGSEDNTFVTGQQVCVDGGYTIVQKFKNQLDFWKV